MGINIDKMNMPVSFELNDDADSRFKKVKVWIAHTGENLNNSYFEKDVLEEMATTLSGIPIVGYIEKTDSDDDEDEDEEDFSNHRNEITLKSNGISIRYAGHAYGFIPKDCNYSFEKRGGKEWLTAEGYVWTKFTDAMKIFSDANGVKSQSMEIDHVEGASDDIGRMVVTSARFSALCILGESVNPAMAGSTIEFFSNKKDQYQQELYEMYQAFELEKGDSSVEDNKKNKALEPEATFEEGNANTTAEGAEDNVDNVDGANFEDNGGEPEATEPAEPTGAAEPEGNFSEDGEPEPTPEPTPEPQEPEQTFSLSDDAITLSFELSHDDVRRGLYSAVRKNLGEREYAYILQVYDNRFIVEKTTYSDEGETSTLLSVTYEKNGDEINLSNEEQVFPMFLNASEKEKVEENRAQVASLEAQLQELYEFKAEVDKTKKEELVEEFAEKLGEEFVTEIRGKFAEFSVEDVEKEIALKCFQLIKNKKEEVEPSVSVQNFSKRESKYGTLDRFF